MSYTQTPELIDESVKKMCTLLGLTDSNCVYLESDPTIKLGVPLECFQNTEDYILKNGGTKQLGWRFWTWPNIYIEAELHCVWKSSSGHLIDVTPFPDNERKILFLPDNKFKYKGKRIDNKRLALTKNPIINRFFKVAEELYRWYNTYGNISIEEGSVDYNNFNVLMHLQLVHQSMLNNGLTTVDNCPCKSNNLKSYNACCRQLYN